jgi:hypothetical protein
MGVWIDLKDRHRSSRAGDFIPVPRSSSRVFPVRLFRHLSDPLWPLSARQGRAAAGLSVAMLKCKRTKPLAVSNCGPRISGRE